MLHFFCRCSNALAYCGVFLFSIVLWSFSGDNISVCAETGLVNLQEDTSVKTDLVKSDNVAFRNKLINEYVFSLNGQVLKKKSHDNYMNRGIYYLITDGKLSRFYLHTNLGRK